MKNPVFLAYCTGMVSMLIPIFLFALFPYICFKRQDYSNCHKCAVFSCPRSAFWKEPKEAPRGLLRFSPVLIYGVLLLLAALFLSLLWFIMICLTLTA